MVTKPKSVQIPTQTDALFDMPSLPPHSVSKTFSHTGAGAAGRAPTATPAGKSGEVLRVSTDADGTFRSQRAEGIPALNISAFDRAEEWEREFLKGCELMGFEPTPQQWKIADAVNAHDDDGFPLNATVGICVPRRAGKTTALLALALGRCSSRPDYVVKFTAQSGTKARDRFLGMARILERKWPNEYERGFRLLKGAGHMVVEFTNGSVFQVVPPKGESFRGDEGDLLILDEAQEHDVEVSAELLAGCLATMDTRPGAQLLVAGTTGEQRSGIFWDTLEDGRADLLALENDAEPDEDATTTGIIEFAADPELQAVELMTDGQKDWAKAKPIVLASHPGIGTLTTLKIIRARFEKLGLPQFMREYLGVWPEDYSKGAIDLAKWRACHLDEFTKKPADFALAFDVNPNGSSAAIAAAWRVDGIAYVEIIDHQPGTDWLVKRVADYAKKYRVTVGHDTVGAVLVEAEALQRHRPAPRRKPIGYKDIGAMCASFMKEITVGRLRHFDQAELNAAAAGVVKRDLGENAWAWGRRQSVDVDITPLVAANIALRTFDTSARRGNNRMISSTSIARKAS